MNRNNKTPEEKKDEIISELSKCYGIITLACRKAKVGRTSYYKYLETDAEFASKVKQIQDAFVDYVESLLFDLMKAGDRGAMMFYLKAKGKDRGYR